VWHDGEGWLAALDTSDMYEPGEHLSVSVTSKAPLWQLLARCTSQWVHLILRLLGCPAALQAMPTVWPHLPGAVQAAGRARWRTSHP